METYPLSIAIFDFVPVTLFLVGAFFLAHIALMQRGTQCGRMVMAGALLIFAGGFLKALWKILYTTQVADIRWMGEIQFLLVAPGFLALLVTAILLARGRKKSKGTTLLAILPWKIPFLALMTLASMGANGILTYISFRRGAKWAALGFIIAFLGLIGMGAMASGEQTLARQWIEEITNATSQLGFCIGSILLYQNFKKSEGTC